MSRTIQLIISPQGETRLETRGFLGNQCRRASRLLEEALGQRTREQRTAEFYQAPATQVQRHHRQ